MNISNPLRIGSVIREVLMSNEILVARVGDRIRPYTTQSEIPLPHIVYDGVSVDFEDYKDGPYATTASITLNVNTSDYQEGIDIAEEVLDILCEHDGVSPSSASCEYSDAANMFTHQLTFNIQIA